MHPKLRAASWPKLLAVAALCAGSTAASAVDLHAVVAGMAEGSWLKVNQNAVSSVWTPPELREDNAMSRIIGAWSSFAWDSNRQSLIIYGGGHANYIGNDVYTFNGSTLLWERSSLPSKMVPTTVGVGYTYGFPADGSMNAPASAHTYDNTVFLTQADRYLTFGGAAWNNGAAYLKANGDGSFTRTGPYTFDPKKADANKVGGTTGSGVNPSTLGSQAWQNRDALVTNGSGSIRPKGIADGFSDTMVINGKDVVYVGGAQDGTAMDLYRYTIHDPDNPALDTWELVGINWNTLNTGNSAGALDPGSNLFVRTGDATRNFLMWDLSAAGPANHDQVITPLDLTGGLAPTSFGGWGLTYDPQRDQFVLWGGGPNVFGLAAPTAGQSQWTLSLLDGVGNGPGAQDTNGGVLGKWHYASDLDAFVALQGPTTGDVWVYKPENWVDPLPVPEPPVYVLMALGLLAVAARKRAARS